MLYLLHFHFIPLGKKCNTFPIIFTYKKRISRKWIEINELVKTIQQLAKAQGKNIKDVAREAGVGENAIYRWSTNEPKISTLRKVADVLGIDYKVLLP